MGNDEPGAAATGHELLYGFHTVTAALANPNRSLHALWASRNAAERIKTLPGGTRITTQISDINALNRLAGNSAVHQGLVLRAAALPAASLEDACLSQTVVALDQISDPRNVGAIMRTCAAFGVKVVITTDRHAPSASAVLAKAASGALEHVGFVRVTNLARALEHLRRQGHFVIGLDGNAAQTMARITPPGSTTIVLGGEGKGLRRLTRQKCDVLARIALPGAIKSLNVSNAAALALSALIPT